MKKVELHTDGSCLGNPGPGGWAAILVHVHSEAERSLELSGGYAHTSNNRMELMAVIEGLCALKCPCEVTVFSDSRYVCDSVEKGWLKNWQKNNWRKANKKPVLNQDLWKRFLEIIKSHKVSFCWVKGHAGNVFNERCDVLAKLAAKGQDLKIDNGFSRKNKHPSEK